MPEFLALFRWTGMPSRARVRPRISRPRFNSTCCEYVFEFDGSGILFFLQELGLPSRSGKVGVLGAKSNTPLSVHRRSIIYWTRV